VSPKFKRRGTWSLAALALIDTKAKGYLLKSSGVEDFINNSHWIFLIVGPNI
jgi:hypothetical protein